MNWFTRKFTKCPCCKRPLGRCTVCGRKYWAEGVSCVPDPKHPGWSYCGKFLGR